MRNFDQVVKNIDSKEEQLVDVRPKDDFNSINPDTNKPNNIPNSINVPFGEIFDKNSGTIKDKNELKASKNKSYQYKLLPNIYFELIIQL